MAPAAVALLVVLIPAIFTATASAAVVEHTFNVGGMEIWQLCMNSVIYTVNQQLPGPTIEVSEGDTLVVHVVNGAPYPMSMHWHGIFQLQSGWADGAHMITQCPIPPSGKFTYVFNVTGQEGTLWWHAHSSMLRATIYGALIIKPRGGYPFPAPYAEIPILLGEWWNRNVDDVETDGLLTGLGPAMSDAFTINGSPGDQTPCGGAGIFQVEVEPGKTYLLRIINAAVNAELFFRVAGHTFTVVAVDASYTNPHPTDVGEEGELQRRGGGGAAERGVQQRARRREPPDPPARVQLLRAGAGARALRPRDEEHVQPREPAGAQHRRRAGRRLGRHPLHGEQSRYVVHALSPGRAPAIGVGHGFRGAQRTGAESATSTSCRFPQVSLNVIDVQTLPLLDRSI